jgi:hypothetical protein
MNPLQFYRGTGRIRYATKLDASGTAVGAVAFSRLMWSVYGDGPSIPLEG